MSEASQVYDPDNPIWLQYATRVLAPFGVKPGLNEGNGYDPFGGLRVAPELTDQISGWFDAAYARRLAALEGTAG